MIKRDIEICGKLVPFRSSATVPRLYRAKFKRDIFKDLSNEEWLDQFDMFSIYEVLPQILELWGDNMVTEVKTKKELAEVAGK